MALKNSVLNNTDYLLRVGYVAIVSLLQSSRLCLKKKKKNFTRRNDVLLYPDMQPFVEEFSFKGHLLFRVIHDFYNGRRRAGVVIT